jgi:hypothetical protein
MPTKFDKEINELERIVERIPEEVLDVVRERVYGNSYFMPLEGYHSFLKLIGYTCKESYIFLISGNDTTGENGEIILSINRILCDYKIKVPNIPDSKDAFLIHRPQFTALPEKDKPTLLTTSFSLTTIPPAERLLVDREGNVFTGTAFDVKIKVMSWNVDGSKAGQVPFSWMCTVEAAWNLPLSG